MELGDVQKGDLVQYRGKIWMVKKSGTTWIHEHPYVDLISYDTLLYEYDEERVLKENSKQVTLIYTRRITWNPKTLTYDIKEKWL